MQNVKNTIIDRLLSLVAPHLCYRCGGNLGPICDNCKYDINSQSYAICVVCNGPSESGICIDHHVYYQFAWVVGARNGALRQVLNDFKFHHRIAAGMTMVSLLDGCLPSLPAHTIVTTIPTLPSHIRQRGYDHAAFLAKGVARQRDLRFQQVLERHSVATQHRLNRRERLKTARHAYSAHGIIAGRPYLIIDDTITTGATLEAAAHALFTAGVRTIWVAAVAHQPLD